MLRAFLDLGKVAENKGLRARDLLSGIDIVFTLRFGKNLNYIDLRLEDFKNEEQWKYLYAKRGNSKNTPGFTPTIVKAKDKLKKELSEKKPKTLEWLFSSAEQLFGKPLEGSMDEIKEDLKMKVKDLNKAHQILITIKIDDKYLGEIQEVVEKVENLIRRWYEKERKGGEGICSLCFQKKKVIGDYFPITVYTVDNPAYAPYIDKGLAYRHMPACADCLETVKKGVEAAGLWFKFSMAGFEYLFIPEGNVQKIEELVEVLKDDTSRKSYLGAGNIDPEDINEYIREKSGIEDDLRVLLLYLERNQNAIRILHSIEDIFPSRLGYLYKLKREIEEKFTLGEKFSYKTIRRLTPDRDSFFALLRASFLGEKVEPSGILLSGFRKIQNNNLKYLCYDFVVSYLFIKKAMEGKNMAEFNKLEEENPEDFFRKYFKEDEVLVGLALLGFLVAYVEKVQYAKGYTPNLYLLFREFSLDWRGVEELMRELMNKATKYNLGEKFYTLYAKAIKRLGFEGRGKKRDDINTALCVGYGIGKNLKSGGEQDEET